MASKLPTSRQKSRSIEDVLSKLSDEKLMGDFDDILELVPVVDDTSCGFGFLRGSTLQK